MTTKAKWIKMPCLHCGKDVKVKKGSHEYTGVFNVFCNRGKDNCEDRYAATL